jgi:hypothetical protein
MKLTNMKMPAAVAEEKYPETVMMDRPRYPWGLSLSLDEDAIEKLGIDLPKVGSSLRLEAMVDVTRVEAEEYQDHEGKTRTRRSVAFQLTDVGFEAPDDGETTEKLYGKG